MKKTTCCIAFVCAMVMSVSESVIAVGPATGNLSHAGAIVAPSFERNFTTMVNDFDLDGLFDVATLDKVSGRLVLRYGVNQDELSDSFFVWDGDPGSIMTSGDLDGDGFPDIVLSSRATSTVIVLLNDGTGAFLDSYYIVSDVEIVGVVVGDINESGKADLILVGADDTMDVLEDPFSFVFDSRGVSGGVSLPDVTISADPLSNGGGLQTNGNPGGYYSGCGSAPACGTPGAGIQACLSGTWCRAARCHWAACTLNKGGFFGSIKTSLSHAACAVVADLEAGACIPVH